ncbi:MAG: cytochrome c biogenesis protein ResB [Planctomycetota bacterium]
MSYKSEFSATLLNIISSSKLALILVGLLILFALAGAVLPQQGMLEPDQITQWQKANPILTTLLGLLGFFNVFHSWPFLINILLLALNTLTCTILRFLKEGGISGLKGTGATERIGSFVLHVSLILLLAGGFCSAGLKLDGNIVLTEGQSFREQHDGYLKLVEGPLRSESHEDFDVVLKNVQIEYERKKYPVDMASNLEFFHQGRKLTQATVKVNKPFTFRSLDFTQDETGFSPRLIIRDRESNNILINSFIALKTFRTKNGSEYKDFLPLAFLENRIIITLYPSYAVNEGRIEKSGEEPENPLLLIEVEDKTGQVISQTQLLKGSKIKLGKYSFEFVDLRRWASFRIVHDPGYLVLCLSLWLGLFALILRYSPDLYKWLRIPSSVAEN